MRLGVTGLSGAGKTVFITALVHQLLHGGRLPVFEAMASGRVARARLEPQPDDAVPRFDYETHVRALTVERNWPESTSRISELRLVIEYQSARRGARNRTLTLDIVDYPGEWLLDLPLLNMSFAQWSAATLKLSHSGPRALLAARWHRHLATLHPDAPENEQAAREAARLFTEYLKECRNERYEMRLLPPGRFLMPGDLAGSPALTFAPLELSGEGPKPGSLWAMMERRYEAYKDVVVRPFYREHFARLDRQIVLVDALAAFNAGPEAVKDLESALAAILASFRTGRATIASSLFRPRIDRILFAATKADHLHHVSHDRLERFLAHVTERAIARAKFSGATVDVVALAAVRATREATVARGRDKLPAITGTPLAGEAACRRPVRRRDRDRVVPGRPAGGSGRAFPRVHRAVRHDHETDYRFVRFRPPPVEPGPEAPGPAPHPPRPCAAIPARRPARMTPQTRRISSRRSARHRGAGRRRARRARARCGCCRSPRISICRCRLRRRCRSRRRFSWGMVFWSALGGLVALGIGLATTALIEELYARAEWLGTLGGGARRARRACAAGDLRAARSSRFVRLASIEKLRARAEAAIAQRRPRRSTRDRARIERHALRDAAARARPQRTRQITSPKSSTAPTSAHRRAQPDGAARP